VSDDRLNSEERADEFLLVVADCRGIDPTRYARTGRRALIRGRIG